MRYRLWYVPQVGMGKSYEEEFDNLYIAARVLNTIYQLALWEFENYARQEAFDMGGVQYFNEYEQEWWDVDYSELEDDIEYAEAHGLTPKQAAEVADILR